MIDVPAGAISGLAFFPGGSGTWAASGQPATTLIPKHACVFLGQDFGRYSDYLEAVDAGEENRNVDTWKRLIALLDSAGLDDAARSSCFFTNAVMGLRTTEEIEGESPGSKHPGFRSACVAFLRLQLQLIEPRAVIALGWQPLGVLASFCDAARLASRCGTFRELDDKRLAMQAASIEGDCGRFVLGVLMHPVARPFHVAKRRFGDAVGNAAQAAIVRACWEAREVDAGHSNLIERGWLRP
jgi:hypothetical protein